MTTAEKVARLVELQGELFALARDMPNDIAVNLRPIWTPLATAVCAGLSIVDGEERAAAKEMIK